MRAICSHLSTPIIGDMQYGGGKFSHFMLHSAALNFPSVDGRKEYMIIDSPDWVKFGVKSLTRVAENLNLPPSSSLNQLYHQQ